MISTLGTGEPGGTRQPAGPVGAGGHPPPAGGGGQPPAPGKGEAAAVLDDLYNRYWTDLVKYINRMLSDPHQAEEIAQESMLRAWRHAATLVPERGSVWGWLCRVARNVTVDRIRYKRARPPEVEESTAADPQLTSDHSTDVANYLYMTRALAQLPAPQRAVLYLVYYQDKTCAETAEILDVPVGTAKSRLHYGLRNLRALLEPDRVELARVQPGAVEPPPGGLTRQ